MEIILQEDVEELGLVGDIVNVARGYARNYLIPKRIALEASPQNIKALELRRKKIDAKRLRDKSEAERQKQDLEGILITFSKKAGEEGKLYGSVTTMDIASYLEEKGFLIDRRKIALEKPIKALGEFDVLIKVYPEVTASLKVAVLPKEEKQKDG